MAKRWQHDTFDLKPTVLSILIGINDTWHGTAKGTPKNGVGLNEYHAVYRQLLDQTRDALPGIRLIICEPFTTQAGNVLELPFHPEVDERRAIAQQVAADYDAIWVPFQSLFDQLCEKAQPNHWAHDGVHPTAAGHHAMAEFWLETVRSA